MQEEEWMPRPEAGPVWCLRTGWPGGVGGRESGRRGHSRQALGFRPSSAMACVVGFLMHCV